MNSVPFFSSLHRGAVKEESEVMGKLPIWGTSVVELLS